MNNSSKSIIFKLSGLLILGALVSAAETNAEAAPAKSKAVANVVWAKSHAAAVQQAKRTGKPIFIDFYTEWCSPCKYLEQTTYKDPKFVAASRKWVMLKINPEKSKLGEQLFTRYKANGYPSLIMLADNRKKLDGVAGAYPASLLVPIMEKARKKNGKAQAVRA